MPWPSHVHIDRRVCVCVVCESAVCVFRSLRISESSETAQPDAERRAAAAAALEEPRCCRFMTGDTRILLFSCLSLNAEVKVSGLKKQIRDGFKT